MAKSIWSPKLQAAFEDVETATQPEGVRALAAPTVAPPFPSPTDWRDIWIYMIMTDRFNRPQVPPKSAWDHRYGQFQGGTFEGVRQQLDYLRDLGVGAIWLTPVLKNCTYFNDTFHGYGIQDFVEIDPRYASDPVKATQDPTLVERELRALIDDAHERGIYVIFDIVLNHVGDLFVYGDGEACAHSEAPWLDHPYPTIHWRDATGCGRPEWTEIPADPNLSTDAVVWPQEFQSNAYFRRQGKGAGTVGDFVSLKQMRTDLQDFSPQDGQYYPVRNALIRVYQYLIAKYDVDGYRIDTLKYVPADFALTFGNAMREYALSIGKKNFFTYGEVYDNEEEIARFIGRNTSVNSDMLGVDASLDFPLFFTLPSAAKGQAAPATVAGMYEHRKQVEANVLTSHGEAGAFFVTFLDNHDQPRRFYYSDPNDPHRYDAQATLGLACLFALQGIPCVYYGTEQGLNGAVDSNGSDQDVREALWGKNWPNAFDRTHPFYKTIARLSALRNTQPALRYGRQYFRPISGNGQEFGVSPYANGVLAFERILSDQAVLVVANTNPNAGWDGDVIVDFALNPSGTPYTILFSNRDSVSRDPDPVAQRSGNGVIIHEVDGSTTNGPVRVVPVHLAPMEIQFLSRVRAASTRSIKE
jgi:glycosidase